MCKDELQNERFAKPSQSLSGALREPPKTSNKNPNLAGLGLSGTQRYQRTSSVHQVDAIINLGIHVIRSALCKLVVLPGADQRVAPALEGLRRGVRVLCGGPEPVVSPRSPQEGP